MSEDKMAGWHHRLDGHGFGWTPGVGDGKGGLACCDSWGRKELDTTEQLNCFCTHSASLYLLVGAFNSLTFKVITDKYDPVAIYFIILGSGLYTLFVFPV